MLMALKLIYKINIKDIKNIGENNKQLDEEVSKYPSNIEICKTILKKLNNENVKIEENEGADSCVYIALSNKIIIANMRNSFTRIQTISHECLHSIQDRGILLFNYIYSNLYIMYFIIMVILGIFKILPYKILFFILYILLSFIYYFIRSYLENDAMIKARYIAEEYIREQKISSEKNIKEILNQYDKLNHIGIKTVNYGMFLMISIKIIILALIFLIR
jgi:hypothetical protein